MKRIYRFEEVEQFDLSTDIAIAGFGGAGACAALEARRAGADVAVFEWASGGGGSTMLSAGEMYLGGGTRLQKDLGIEDSPDNFYRYMEESFGCYSDAARLRTYVDGAAEHFDWLEDLGIEYRRGFFEGRDFTPVNGDSLMYNGSECAHPFSEVAQPAPRGHVPGGTGRDHSGGIVIMNALMNHVAKAGAEIYTDARVTALIQDETGRIRGLIVKMDNKQQFVLARKGVVLCMGGFIMNEQMTQQHIPYWSSIGDRLGNPNDIGEGILLGVAAGGHAINMGEAFLSLPYYVPSQLTYGIFVNEQGQRFINEDIYVARIGYHAAIQYSDQVYMLIDNKYFERPKYAAAEIVAVGETIEEVEVDSGLPEGNLQHTVAYYNRYAARGEDPLFHKSTDWLDPLVTPPYALLSFSWSEVETACFTLGGLDALPTGEVLTPEREVIPGLYAAGRTAASVPRTSRGYNSGMSVGDATFFGRLAGIQAATSEH